MLANCLKKNWSLLLILLYVPFLNYPEMDHLSSSFAFDFLFCVQIHAPFSILTVHSFLWTCNYKLQISVECFWLPCSLQWFPPTSISICFTFSPHSMYKCPTVMESHLSTFLFMCFGFSICIALATQDYKNIHPRFLAMKENRRPFSSPNTALPPPLRWKL